MSPLLTVMTAWCPYDVTLHRCGLGAACIKAVNDWPYRDLIHNSTIEGSLLKFNFVSFRFLAAGALLLLLCVHTTQAQQPPRRIEITAKRFEFTPAEITLKKGEPVVLVLKSIDVAHGVRFRELGITTKADKGKSSELAFTPDKLGDFVGHCAVFCGAGHGEMMLTMHVVQ